MKYQEINAKAVDSWIKEGWEWGKPITHETYLKAQKGEWDVLLTPTKPVPHSWFGSLKGKKVLGLASGGGQQMPIFAALGAECTVLDYSDEQLKSEKMVSEREGYAIKIIKADMTEPLPFETESFDLIFHPISNCYIEKIEPVFKEAYRILKKGGIFLCGFDLEFDYLFNEEETGIRWTPFPFNPLKHPEQMQELAASNSGVQFSHTLEEEIGGQLKAGFILTDIYDDTGNEGPSAQYNLNCFVATRAIKPK
ncbi:MAG: methyltransferase domain-containing protein [Bacilli bacterium]|nr:methyltransferase domain-containing protein [Bacilli bacterium]